LSTKTRSLGDVLQEFAHHRQVMQEELQKVIVGQAEVIEQIFAAVFTRGHCLLVGVPGLAKTLMVSTLARILDIRFKRIQFTPDLLPSDLLGTQVFHPKTGDWSVREGPVFANFVLADEINRAPAKVQSALLEAMQERQVTIGDQTHRLPDPFLVLATQNPIEQEGTYPLPEAQVDRFMLKLKVDYPDREQEKEILRRMAHRETPRVEAVLTPDDIRGMREVADRVYLDPKVEDYIVDIVFATREPGLFKLEEMEKLIDYGASPRASIFLAQTSKVQAMMSGRTYVTPQDVKTVGPDVLRHRVLISYEAEDRDLTSDDIVQEIFNTVDVP